MKKVRLILTALLLTFGPFLTTNVMAQPGGGGGPGGDDDPGCWPPPCIPIDGGVSWLIAAGAAYGGKKAYDMTKKDKEEETEE